MLTMRAAGAVLSSAGSPDGLAQALRAAGIGADVADLDEASRSALGLDGVRTARLAAAAGTIRILLLQLADDDALRPAIQRLARRLSARAPHVLWLVAVVDASGATAALAGWSLREGTPRLVAFTWEPGRVVDSDAETLCALAATRADADVSLHARYLEILGRDSLTRRFYRALEREVASLSASLAPRDPVDSRDVALLYVSRLLFLRFLEAKGWLDANRDFLVTSFDDCMRDGGGFHRRVLLPLFFGTLNTPVRRRAPRARAFGLVPFLNGGLFTQTAAERRLGAFRFPDDGFGALLERVFLPFRFVAREDSATWSEASVDPEMLGRAFESFMAAGERRAGGVFYTPHELVARVSEHAIDVALAHSRSLRDGLADVRVLDPACGSGAFLVYVLERLSALRVQAGDVRDVATVRRDVLARSIFGVDRNPTAVWLCELRLWLSVAVESTETNPAHVPPLPNLDRNIRVGDALVGAGFGAGAALPGSAALKRMRERYARATGPAKEQQARALDRAERARAISSLERDIERARHTRRERIAIQRARDLFGERSRVSAADKRELRQHRDALRALRREHRRLCDGGALPFAFPVAFADAQAAGGFDVVLGNPPWVRLHRIPIALREQLKRDYAVYRDARWRAGAERADVAPGFASQVDLAALFVERGVSLLRSGGALSFLLPTKLWHSLAGGGVRRLLSNEATVVRVEDLSESPHAFDAAVYPSLIVARRGESPGADVAVAVHARDGREEWTVSRGTLAYDASPGAPWLLLPRDARSAFDCLTHAGVPLAETHFGAPRLGVKSGCNAAFLVSVEGVRGDVASVVDANGERGTIEAALLRPALRGEGTERWSRGPCDESIVWTHGGDGAPLPELPERARRWLRRHYGTLTARSDAARSRRWWTLFRVDAADCRSARVVWSDLGTRPRALVLPPGDVAVPLNSCYVLHASDEDACALAAILNSPLAAAWLNAVAEPARGRYHRYFGWTVGMLPLPREWTRVRASLAQAASDACGGGDDDQTMLQARVLRAYGLRHSDVAALLDWQS